jgi:hypothetical protein
VGVLAFLDVEDFFLAFLQEFEIDESFLRSGQMFREEVALSSKATHG